MTTGRPGRDLARPGQPGTRPFRKVLRHGLDYDEAGGQGPRFGLLLLVLAATYLVSAFLSGTWVSGLQIVLFMMVTGLALRTGLVRRRVMHVVIAAVIIGSAGAVALALTHSADAAAGLANLWAGLLLMLSVVLIVREVLAQPTVTLQSIFGAVSVYLIIGLMFAAFYAAIDRFSGGGFFAHGAAGNIKTFQYFSFTTLTTLGYGDFTAASSGGRAVAVMEAMLGQIFLATLVARLVAAFQPTRLARRGAPASSRRRPRAGRGRPGASE